MSRLGVVIFGATGFTGKCAVTEMVRLSRKHGVSWGVAGRSRARLESLMRDVAIETGEDQTHVRIIVADVTDEQSLQDMCAQAQVIANCCGPYHLYGEAVVKAAIEARTHHVDITGEPQFIESMQLKYGALAREAGVFVISACGFDSIPNDLGTVFLQQQFGGTLNSVESYMSFSLPAKYRWDAMKHGTIHYGTWESVIYGLANLHVLKPLRRKLFPEKLHSFKPKLERRWVIHRGAGGWCVPFAGADNSIVGRTQRALHAECGLRPAHFRAYLCAGAWPAAALLVLWAAAMYLLSRMSLFCRLMREYPRIFTWGVVSHVGPARAVRAHTAYSVTLRGAGWARRGTDAGSPDTSVVAKVWGVNPGYGTTACALLYCAITILEEREQMPAKTGVLTTGTAFRNTNIIKRLSENNMKFEIVETSPI